jgi:acyl-[acyl-carrier-protein] desaturase
MADLEYQAARHDWDLPQDSARGMLIYGMVQELATWVHYRNLRRRVDEVGDPALSTLLGLIAVDERAHHTFYRRVVQLFLEIDRPSTLEQLRWVLHGFAMPAMHLLADSRRRMTQIKSLQIFDEVTYMRQVYEPVLAALGLTRRDLRPPEPTLR